MDASFSDLTLLTSSTTAGLSLGTPATTSGALGARTLSFSLKPPGAAAGTSSATSTIATSTSSTTNTGFVLNLKPLAPISIASSTAATGSTPAAPGAGGGAAGSSPIMTYAQLESLINKRSLELEDQERHFLQQATQVNAWDRTLIENSEHVASLHRQVEKVQLDQKRLGQELDFILWQQKELEDLLNPLEEAVKEQSGTIYLQHAEFSFLPSYLYKHKPQEFGRYT